MVKGGEFENKILHVGNFIRNEPKIKMQTQNTNSLVEWEQIL